MNEYTATYGMKGGTPLPVVVEARTFGEALALFNTWRMRKAENAVADELISLEPISVVNDTLRMEYS